MGVLLALALLAQDWTVPTEHACQWLAPYAQDLPGQVDAATQRLGSTRVWSTEDAQAIGLPLLTLYLTIPGALDSNPAMATEQFVDGVRRALTVDGPIGMTEGVAARWASAPAQRTLAYCQARGYW
jgi:hypothetical protein